MFDIWLLVSFYIKLWLHEIRNAQKLFKYIFRSKYLTTYKTDFVGRVVQSV